MNEGDIALTRLPQADGELKNRPVVVLCRMLGFGDLLVCGVSTQLRHAVAEFDEVIGAGDFDFKHSGLKARLSFDSGCSLSCRAPASSA